MTDSAEIEHTPTFLLRGITHQEVWTDYCRGDFSSMSQIHNIIVDMVGSRLDNKLTDPNTTYNIKTRSNHTMKVLMPGGVQVKNSDGESLKPGGLCGWTREKINGLPAVLPISSSYDPLTETMTYIGLNEFKNFECAHAYYRKFCTKNLDATGSYRNSLVLLRNLFRSLYPEEELLSAPDFSLHENFNGPLNSDNFHNNNHVYYKTSGVRIVPGQLQYIEGVS